MKTCTHFEPKLSAFLFNELPADEAAEVQEHLDACADCTAELNRLAQTTDFLRQAFPAISAGQGEKTASPMDDEQLTRDRQNAILASAQTAAVRPQPILRHQPRRALRPLLSAAACLLVAGLVWLTSRDQPPPPAAPATRKLTESSTGKGAPITKKTRSLNIPSLRSAPQPRTATPTAAADVRASAPQSKQIAKNEQREISTVSDRAKEVADIALSSDTIAEAAPQPAPVVGPARKEIAAKFYAKSQAVSGLKGPISRPPPHLGNPHKKMKIPQGQARRRSASAGVMEEKRVYKFKAPTASQATAAPPKTESTTIPLLPGIAWLHLPQSLQTGKTAATELKAASVGRQMPQEDKSFALGAEREMPVKITTKQPSRQIRLDMAGLPLAIPAASRRQRPSSLSGTFLELHLPTQPEAGDFRSKTVDKKARPLSLPGLTAFDQASPDFRTAILADILRQSPTRPEFNRLRSSPWFQKELRKLPQPQQRILLQQLKAQAPSPKPASAP